MLSGHKIASVGLDNKIVYGVNISEDKIADITVIFCYKK